MNRGKHVKNMQARALHSPSWTRCWTWLLGLGLALCLTACTRTPDEEALRAAIDAMQQAGESRDVPAFMDYVADDFMGNGPEFDRQGLERYLRLIAMRNQALGVTRSGTTIEMHGDRAVVRMTLLLTGGAGWLPERGELLEVESGWRFEGGEWRVASARWKPARS